MDKEMNKNLMATKYVRLPLFESMSGYSEKSVRRKIEDGIWREGCEFKRAPDGHVLVNLEGFEKWVESPKLKV